MFEKKKPEDLGRTTNNKAKHKFIVILDDVRSMHNVGSAFRTCDAFAAEAVYLCGYTPIPPHRDIHKTALGATETVAWKHFADVSEAVAAAKEQGYKIVAVEQVHNSITLQDFKASGAPVALVFGNEVSGVSDKVLSVADAAVEIPQWGAKHSLNISVSVGIVLWELVRNVDI